ncbi:hypothetical protein NC653_002300 [Populus alba x Populus x berolinensis]|uniref:Uncharacterized protein n=1 Tax=Populus alba x Populus x berolinensis TaxID=444605 RepID=A0AAD6WGN0_9ROSI|nr:hypothetical protein NC653_002300 [Populus alba x Populus x berolinensis]
MVLMMVKRGMKKISLGGSSGRGGGYVDDKSGGGDNVGDRQLYWSQDDGASSHGKWQYICRVHGARKSYETRESTWISDERILCIGSSKKRPVVKWENNMAWPGKVTLTDKALYFEAFDLRGKKDSTRLDLTTNKMQVEKTKVGPFGVVLFDSAVSISSGPK